MAKAKCCRILALIIVISCNKSIFAQPNNDFLGWCGHVDTLTCKEVSRFYLMLVESGELDKLDPKEIRWIFDEAKQDSSTENYANMLRKMDRLLELIEGSDNSVIKEKILTRIGQFYFSLRRYERALNYHYKALEAARVVHYTESINFNLIRIAEIYLELDQYDEAKMYVEQALYSERERISNQSLISDNDKIDSLMTKLRGFQEKGERYETRGEYRKALNHYEKGLTEYDEFQNIRVLFLINIALFSWKIENYEESIGVYLEIINFQSEYFNRNQNYKAQILMLVGTLYDYLKEYDKALKFYFEALSIVQQTGNRGNQTYTLDKIGNTYRNANRLDKALKFFKHTLTVERQLNNKLGRARALTNIADIYKRLYKYEKAYSIFQKSLDLYNQLGMVNKPWKAQQGTAEVEVKLNRTDAAITHYLEALDSIEALRSNLGERSRKLSFFKDKLFVYDELIQFLQKLVKKHPDKNFARQALEVFERKQGRIFLEQMGQSGARRFSGLPESMIKKELRLTEAITKVQSDLANERGIPITEQDENRVERLEIQLKDLKKEQNTLQAELEISYPDYYALKYPKPVTLEQLQDEVLDSHEFLLVYSVMEDFTVLWVIGHDVFRMFTVEANNETLAVKVAVLRQAIYRDYQVRAGRGIIKYVDGAFEEYISPDVTAHNLYQLLIPEAVRPLIKDNQLYIVPTGPLYNLPFEMLVTQPRIDKNSAQYLIEAAPISYLSSASLLKVIRDAQDRQNETERRYPLLAFANPIYSDGSGAKNDGETRFGSQQELEAFAELFRTRGLMQPLPETEEEAKEIAKLLEAPRKSQAGVETLQLREAATKQNLLLFNEQRRLDDYRFLLFAMHGVLTDVNRLTQPALAFSYPDQDGYVTMADVFGLKLNADLVMLSACNTGSGDRESAGEGIRGLAGAFLYAGTPAVIVTLWSVETYSTTAFSKGLFANLRSNGLPAQAIRAIKLKMIRGELGDNRSGSWQHPYYWSPFILFGDARQSEKLRNPDNPCLIATLLAEMGYYNRPLEKMSWQTFEEAVRAFQRDSSIEQTGEVDEATWTRLQTLHSSGPRKTEFWNKPCSLLMLTAAFLMEMGYYDKSVENPDSQAISKALRDFQGHSGLVPTGRLNRETWSKLNKLKLSPRLKRQIPHLP